MEDRQILTEFTGIYELDGHLATCNLNPGVRVMERNWPNVRILNAVVGASPFKTGCSHT